MGPAATTNVLPPRLVEHVMTVCLTRPRRCERIVTVVCTSCGWRAPDDDLADPADDGTPSLFAAAPPAELHTAFECRRRQLDPTVGRAETARLARAAGLPTDPRHPFE